MLSANVLFLFLIGIYRAIADSELGIYFRWTFFHLKTLFLLKNSISHDARNVTLFLVNFHRSLFHSFWSFVEATILPVNEPICPSGQINVSTNSFRCFSQQCANFSNGIKCPTEGTIEIISSAGCTCQPGYAYINETDCVPVNSIECGGKGYFWNGSLIEKSMLI